LVLATIYPDIAKNMVEKYNIIYADPPWKYRNDGVNGSAYKKYPQLTDNALEFLPVHSIAAENSVLFLWVTFPKLNEGLSVLRSWGFTFKTVAFVWVKFNLRVNTLFMGPGFYTRANCEICLLGVRGRLPRLSKSVHSVIFAKRKKHSRKPGVTRKRIEKLYGDLPRIELFATESCPGWVSTGFDVDGVDIRDFLIDKEYWNL